MATLPIALVVHGHFYQPPRENPWTDTIEREPSAAPLHDWNARIHAECYRANAFARIHDAKGRIEAIVNNYARMSFNFGPTLARWIEWYDPETHQRLRTADEDQRRRHGHGHGGAVAQAYAHPIVPLLSARDRHTQLLWGLHDFERRFGHAADGLWLPETAVDPATLETLIDLGVKFTILAPEQIAAVKPPGDDWLAVDRDSLDTARTYKWRHRDGSGRSINIAIFDGPLSRSIAFGEAAGRAEAFLDAVRASADRSQLPSGQRLVLCASDGELFGHHKKFADLTLAFASYVEAARQGIEVTNIGAFLQKYPPTWEARIAAGPDGEGTAWSCSHGVGRWRRDCGCSMRGPDAGWNQKWRGPLRDALDLIRDAAADLYEDQASQLLVDPWGARDAYGTVVDASPGVRDQLLATFARPELDAGGAAARDRARLLLELQRATLLMYASCAWFFDDVAGLEASLGLRLCAYAIDLMGQAGGRPPMEAFLARLAQGKSNLREEGSGADVFRRMTGDRFTARHAVGFAGAARLIGSEWLAPVPTGFDVEPIEEHVGHTVAGATRSGRVRATSTRTGIGSEHDFGVIERNGTAAELEIRVDGEAIGLADLGREHRDRLVWAAIRKRLASGTGAGELDLLRLAIETAHDVGGAEVSTPAAGGAAAGGDGEGDGVRGGQRVLVGLFEQLLAHERGALSSEAIAVAAELLDAARLAPGDSLRRRLEEVVWDQIDAGADPRAIGPLTERLGFSDEAIGGEVIAS
jgi:alpha-amylase/alpha-mannosidase (GH57 family)